ncbi:tetratricopeptide repeat protein [uncultured Draconibacterium sp.]|uniref:tetratricopeptide repeat protein n=1 Tax=uncultured Draconibacterium sp. TaxID=1573823 RepID=UPI0032176925
MKKILISVLVLTFLSLTYFASAQMKSANKLYSQLKYYRAIPYFTKVVEGKNDSDKKEATWKLAECYRRTNNPKEAALWFEQAVNFKDVPAEVFLNYGNVLRNLGRYNDAIQQFESYLSFKPEAKEGTAYLEFSRQIESWKNLEPSAVIENDSALNSRFSDFSPVYYKQGLVFISDRDYDMLDNNNYFWTGNGYLNLYFRETETSVPTKMSNEFNQAYHDGPVCFSNNESQIFTTRTLKTKWKRKDTIQTHYTGIYSAQLNVGKLAFNSFEYNNLAYSVAHPAVSEDGKLMIFSSDMPGGQGKSDLYFSELVDGKWSEPKNLGTKINTFGNEYFPFLANGTTLYFASNGHMGYGGLDLYKSEFKNGEWQEPENLKAPINSSYDDFGILLNKDLTSGRFSSNRPGGLGDDDIYKFSELKK